MMITEMDSLEELDFDAVQEYLEIPADRQDVIVKKQENLRKFREEHILEGENTRALVIGRFQPPHAGHLYLIEAALEVADNVVIGIGSANKINRENPLSADQRQIILEDVLKRKGLYDRVRFIHIDDIGDNVPWGQMTMRLAEQWGPVNAVVGNSGWVNGIFSAPEYQKKEIKILQPDILERGLFEGRRVRMDLRASGALTPKKVK